MFGFSKKKNKPTVCNHKWKDFPWYLHTHHRTEYDGEKVYAVEVYEPYICVKCKERRNECLGGFESNSQKARDEKAKEIKETYPDKIKGRLEVEDMVKDEQLVDRDYLNLLAQYENPADTFAGLDLYTEIRKAQKEAGVLPGLAVQIGESNGVKNRR